MIDTSKRSDFQPSFQQPGASLELQSENALKQIGAQLRMYRKRVLKGVSAEDMAKRLGVSRPTYLRLEAGEMTVAVGTWIKAWAVLGVLGALVVAVDPVDEVFHAMVNDLPGCGPGEANLGNVGSDDG